MEYFRPDVKVGGFIFVVLVLLIAGAITIGGVGDWFAATQQYTVLLPNANLLRRRAKVSYAGSPVGEVTAVRSIPIPHGSRPIQAIRWP